MFDTFPQQTGAKKYKTIAKQNKISRKLVLQAPKTLMSRRTNVGKQSDRVDRPKSNDCAVDLQSISADWENHAR